MSTETPIIGKPEGRPGIWLIDAEQAAALVQACKGNEVHNFIGSRAILVGADWDKPSAIEHLRRPDMRIALMFPPNETMCHQLVAINDNSRWAFDVGEISETRMKE